MTNQVINQPDRLTVAITVATELVKNKSDYDGVTPQQACNMIQARTGIILDTRQLRERIFGHFPQDSQPNILFQQRAKRGTTKLTAQQALAKAVLVSFDVLVSLCDNQQRVEMEAVKPYLIKIRDKKAVS